MTDNEALLQAICSDPDNVTLRLVYADWLEDQGDARADFIRVQCELAEMDEDDERWAGLKEEELRLLNWHGAGWTLPPTSRPRFAVFRRGFIDALTMRMDDFVAEGQRLMELTPLREASLHFNSDDISRVAACPALQRLAQLRLHPDVDLYDIAVEELAAMLTSAKFQRLDGLELHGLQIGLTGVRALLKTDWLPNLQHLRLENTDLRAAEMELLANSASFDRLQSLELGNNGFGAVGLQQLAGSRRLPQLQRLRVSGNLISDVGVRGFALSQHFPRLAELDISQNQITSDGVEALASAEQSPLRSLRLDGNGLGMRAFRSLAASPRLATLTVLGLSSCGFAPPALTLLFQSFGDHLVRLDLSANPLGDEGAKVVANARRVAKLRRLAFGDCDLSPWGLKELLWSPHLAALRCLDAASNYLDDRALQVLATCPPRPHLLHLDLSTNAQITDDGLKHLGDGDKLPALRRLSLAGTNLTDAGARTLADSPFLARLVELDLSRTGITAEGVRLLLESPHSGRLQALRLGEIPLDEETRGLVLARFFATSYLGMGMNV